MSQWGYVLWMNRITRERSESNDNHVYATLPTTTPNSPEQEIDQKKQEEQQKQQEKQPILLEEKENLTDTSEIGAFTGITPASSSSSLQKEPKITSFISKIWRNFINKFN